MAKSVLTKWFTAGNRFCLWNSDGLLKATKTVVPAGGLVRFVRITSGSGSTGRRCYLLGYSVVQREKHEDQLVDLEMSG